MDEIRTLAKFGDSESQLPSPTKFSDTHLFQILLRERCEHETIHRFTAKQFSDLLAWDSVDSENPIVDIIDTPEGDLGVGRWQGSFRASAVECAWFRASAASNS